MPSLRLLNWVDTVLGRRLSVDAPGGQCMDLVQDYVTRVYGMGHLPGNAVDQPREAIWRLGWLWVPNGPNNFPPPGAVVVWGMNGRVGTSVYGHIAVALTADSMHILSIDENWPAGSPASFVWHSYDGVMGWFVPRQ